MIKCEMHLHVLGTSPCAKVAPDDIARLYSEAGYGAIVVTNHYMKYLFSDYYKFDTEEEKIKFYIVSYKSLKKSCKPYCIKVFLGMELNPEFINTLEHNPAAEILCYGVTEKFLYKYQRLYDYSLKDLFELFEKNGIVIFQSHPFRDNCIRFDPKYLHGVEIYNGHPMHNSHNDTAKQYAKDNNLLSVSGSDFHEIGNTISGGIYIPESINDSPSLARYIKNNPLQLIRKEI